MSGYFDQFPQIYYTFDPNLQEFKSVVNIFVRMKLLDSILQNIAIFDTYDVKDGDTPESIAYKLYNDSERHWIVLYANQIVDPYFQWPLTVDQLNQNLVDQFGSIENAVGTLHHIEKRTNVITTINYQQTMNTYISIIDNDVLAVDGSSTLPTISNPVIQVGANNVVTFSDGSVVDTSVQLVAVSNYDYTVNQNESQRTIKLVRPEFVNQIEQEFQNLASQ